MQTGRYFYIKILKYKTSALSLNYVNKKIVICAFKILNENKMRDLGGSLF